VASLKIKNIKNVLNGSVGTIAVGFILVLVVSSFWVGSLTYQQSNVQIILSYLSIPLIIGVFSSFGLLAGVVDLSIGSMVGLSGVIFSNLSVQGVNPWLSGLISLLICVGFGSINAIAIVGFKANPIAVTLGMLVALRGLSRLIIVFFFDPANAQASFAGATPYLNESLNNFTEGMRGFFPQLFIVAFLLVVLAQIFITYSRPGRHLRATGGDEIAAKRAGLPIGKIRVYALLTSALGAGIGGILSVGRQGSSSQMMGTNLEFQIYAALMIGGYSILRGGVGNPVGAFMGLLIIAMFSNLMDNKGIDVKATDLFVGLLLLAVIFIDRLRGADKFE
jgi:ribose/xylose/arabinose/galactoside ABC-type transport system permease subunit